MAKNLTVKVLYKLAVIQEFEEWLMHDNALRVDNITLLRVYSFYVIAMFTAFTRKLVINRIFYLLLLYY